MAQPPPTPSAPRRGRPPSPEGSPSSQVIAVRVPGELRRRLDAYLARVQAECVREFGLPRWMYLYAVGRHAYTYIPPAFKRMLRRGLMGSRERDV